MGKVAVLGREDGGTMNWEGRSLDTDFGKGCELSAIIRVPPN